MYSEKQLKYIFRNMILVFNDSRRRYSREGLPSKLRPVTQFCQVRRWLKEVPVRGDQTCKTLKTKVEVAY